MPRTPRPSACSKPRGAATSAAACCTSVPDGEVTEDPVWLWTSTPDRYLDSALRLAIASNPDIRLVDVRGGRSLAVTLVTWQLESSPSPRLVGAVEVEVTTARSGGLFGDRGRGGSDQRRPARRPERGRRPVAGAPCLRLPDACDATGFMTSLSYFGLPSPFARTQLAWWTSLAIFSIFS